jgi:asparagine synthase (glutamine-hydrolysing)
MCGIFFVLNQLNSGNITQNNLYNSFQNGTRRGPDNSTIEFNQFCIGFHRLSINGLDSISNQPIKKNKLILICNGEIYNYKDLYSKMNVSPQTNSDCEIIIDLYQKYGIEHTITMLDGVFAFVLIDNRAEKTKVFVCRDPYGVRPLFVMYNETTPIVFSSEIKTLIDMKNDSLIIEHFNPNTCIEYISDTTNTIYYENNNFNIISNSILTVRNNTQHTLEYYLNNIKTLFTNAVSKRVNNTDRKIACLLSGGLDSSIVTSIASRFTESPLETYSIGLEGGEDLSYAREVADYLGTNHHEVVVTEDDFFESIKEVIYNIESYDTTTVRASVGNYLVCKYISENSDVRVILNGDGSDELMGGYLYMHYCKDDIEFDYETKRLLKNIFQYDVLRSDKSISSNGLEPRTPFLDKTFVQYYLSIPIEYRNHNNSNQIEKFLFRKAFDDGEYLPKSVLWRRKEAFSDGVSSLRKSWYEIINTKVNEYFKVNMIDTVELFKKYEQYENPPTTLEQLYYRNIFERYYPNCSNVISDFWMPKYINANDSSARTLSVYSDKLS